MKKKGIIGLVSTLSLAGVTAIATVGCSAGNKGDGKYTITFETNGGEAIATEQINIGEYLTGPTASRPGYEFLGWYTDAQCTKQFDFNTTPISSNITLYAKWGVKYTVTFDSKGGSEIESVRVVEGNQLVEPTEQPIKSGYIFAGWYSDESCNNLYDFNQAVNDNITLHAKWEVAYTVTFDTCGGELMTAQQVANGSQIVIETPTWGNYEFQGWYLDENFETALSSDYSITENITLYAKWPINIDDYYEFNKNTGNTYEIKSYKQKNNESVTNLCLPLSYHGMTINSVGDNAFTYSYNLNSIVIPDSVTTIGKSAFQGCYNAISINIPDNVTSLGEQSFDGCSSLKSIIIPNKISKIENKVFHLCQSLESIIIPNNVFSIGEYAFGGCENLVSVEISNSVTKIGWEAFGSCFKLESITIPNSVVEIEGYAFASCIKLDGIIIPDSVKTVGDNAFQGLRFTSIIIPETVTNLGREIFFQWTDTQTIYLEFSKENLPSTWNSNWNKSCDARVLFYGTDWEYVDGVPTEIQK